MTDKQRYYASLERQRAAEDSFRNQGAPGRKDSEGIEDLYADMGVRTFAAFQNCLDWLAGLGTSRRNQLDGLGSDMLPQMAVKLDSNITAMATNIAGLKEQLSKLEVAVNNLEAGMRRIDRYTLDAFRQLTELDTAKIAVQPEPVEQRPMITSRRLAKEDARRLALDTARRMAAAGQALSLAAVAREASLKYGQIVYAFGNKDNFLDELANLAAQKDSDRSPLPPAQHEVAVAEESAV